MPSFCIMYPNKESCLFYGYHQASFYIIPISVKIDNNDHNG